MVINSKNASKTIKARSWFLTVQIKNMRKTGLSEAEFMTPSTIADFLCDTWEKCGETNIAAITVCQSADGLYHAHMGLYGNTTTLHNVSKIMFESHVEPAYGKTELIKYLLKEAPYDRKGEIVLYQRGLDRIQSTQGKRNDLAQIQDMLKSGMSPNEIFEANFSYRKYEKMILSAYLYKRRNETPAIKEKMDNVWVIAENEDCMRQCYQDFCSDYGQNQIYLWTDPENGGMDHYNANGAPDVLLLYDFSGEIKLKQLLTITGNLSRAQIHCRFENCYCLWNKVIIISLLPPENFYSVINNKAQNKNSYYNRLLKQLTEIRYQYTENGHQKSFSIPAEQYVDFEHLKNKILLSGIPSVHSLGRQNNLT